MRLNILTAVAVALFTSLATSAETARTVDIFAWPLSEPKSQTFAQISYTSTNATVKTHKGLSIKHADASDDEIVRVGFYHASGAWSGVATSASNFAPGKDKKLILHLNTDDQLYHVGFKTSHLPSSSKTGTGKDGLSVEVVKVQPGPAPHLNKPIVLNEEGQLPGKEPEKTFLQKYWWVIAGVLLLQIVMGSGKE